MASQLHLTWALGDNPRTRPILDETVKVDGIESVILEIRPPERHRRMLNHLEFDVCELSLGSYLASVEQDYPFTAIPVFPYRRFRHGNCVIHNEAGITRPADLSGRRIGLRRWQNTAGMWLRGIFSEYYGFDMKSAQWYIDDEDEISVDLPTGFDVDWLSENKSVNQMLANGELDAVMYPSQPSSLEDPESPVELLFPNYKREQRRWYQRSGLFPLMHVIVIRDSIAEEHPWVPKSVQKVFKEANERAIADLGSIIQTCPSVSWGSEYLKERSESYDILEVEQNLWSYDLADVGDCLQKAIEYAQQLGLVSHPLDHKELFFSSSLETLPND